MHTSVQILFTGDRRLEWQKGTSLQEKHPQKGCNGYGWELLKRNTEPPTKLICFVFFSLWVQREMRGGGDQAKEGPNTELSHGFLLWGRWFTPFHCIFKNQLFPKRTILTSLPLCSLHKAFFFYSSKWLPFFYNLELPWHFCRFLISST